MSALMGQAGAVAAVPAEMMKIITGIVQAKRAKDLRDKTTRPVMGVPEAVNESVGVARNAYQDPRMAGQQYFLDQLGANQATATRGAYQMGGSAAERQNAAILGQSGANSATNQLGAQAAQQQANDARALMSQLGQLGQYQQQAWQYNQADPFAEAQAAAMREGNASNANIYGGLKGLGGAAMSAFTPQQSAGTPGLPSQQSQTMSLRKVDTGFNPNMQLPQRPVPTAMMPYGEYPNEAAEMLAFNKDMYGASFNSNPSFDPNADQMYKDIFNIRDQSGYQSQTGYMPMDMTALTMDSQLPSTGIATTNPDGSLSYDRNKSSAELQALVKLLGGK